MVRAIFLMEQHLGHQTYYTNLRRFAERMPDLQCTWVPVTYKHGSRLLDLTPGLSNHVRGTLQGTLQVWRALERQNYDVAFFNTQVPAALAASLVRRRPYVLATDMTPLQYDGMSHLYGHQPDRAGLVSSYKHHVNLEILRGAAAVLPWSAWARESLIADYGVAAECIEVIPPGVDLSLWAPATQRRPGPLRILFVGGDFYRKGGATLLQVFRALPSGSAELHVVTKTELQPENGLHMYYELQPNSPGLIARYQASDVFVLPSEAEAFGIAAVEACASGLALIATAMGGLTDIVEEGKTGFLIPPQSPAALCERLQRLVNNPVLLAEMGRAARVRAEERFSAQRNTARIIEHLRQAAGGATSP